jgi:dipeptidyl aminopeptidase/acylaminoacyl peptidase
MVRGLKKMVTFKKISKYFLLLLLSVVVVFIAISYMTLKKFTGRLSPAQEKSAYVRRHQEYLTSSLGGQRVTFTAADGITLSGILFTRPGAQRTIIVVHGYRMTKERLGLFPHMLPDDNILLFDVRGHGESGGELITFGCHEHHDVKAAADFIRSHHQIAHLPIYGIGISMGGVALLSTVQRYPDLFKAIVIDSAFSDLYNQLARSFERRTNLPRKPFFGITQFLFEYMSNACITDVSPRRWAQEIQVPVLLIHSEGDMLSPIADVYETYEALLGKKSLWVVSESAHARIFKDMPEEYFEHIDDFIATHA